jgi:hypothetical protein
MPSLGFSLQTVEQPVSQQFIDTTIPETPIRPAETLGDKGREGKRDGTG